MGISGHFMTSLPKQAEQTCELMDVATHGVGPKSFKKIVVNSYL